VTAAQVLRPVLAAEAAEIDDLIDALVARHSGKCPRGGPVSLDEVARTAAAHGVDEVVRNVDAAARATEGLRL
jgi:hypothetical protein